MNITVTFRIEADAEVISLLNRIAEKENKIMAAIDDLKTAVTRSATSVSGLLTSVTDELKAIADKLAAIPDNADVAAAAVAINAVCDKVDGAKAALDTETALLTGLPPAGPPVS